MIARIWKSHSGHSGVRAHLFFFFSFFLGKISQRLSLPLNKRGEGDGGKSTFCFGGPEIRKLWRQIFRSVGGGLPFPLIKVKQQQQQNDNGISWAFCEGWNHICNSFVRLKTTKELYCSLGARTWFGRSVGIRFLFLFFFPSKQRPSPPKHKTGNAAQISLVSSWCSAWYTRKRGRGLLVSASRNSKLGQKTSKNLGIIWWFYTFISHFNKQIYIF